MSYLILPITITVFASLFMVTMLAPATESDQVTDILQWIERVNQLDFPYHNQCGGLCFFNSLFSSGKSDKLLHKCMVDICGPPDENPKFILNNTSFSESLDPAVLAQFDQKVAPAIKAGLDRRRQHYKKTLDDLEGLKTTLDQDPTHPEWSAIAHAIITSNSRLSRSEKGTPINVARKKNHEDSKKSAFILASLQRENALREEIADTVRNQPIDSLRKSLRNRISARLKGYGDSNSLTDLSSREDMEIRSLLAIEKNIENAPRPLMEDMMVNISAEAKMKTTSCQEESCRQIIQRQLDILKANIEATAEKAKEKYDEIQINRCKSHFIEKTEAMKHTQVFRSDLSKYKEKITTTGLASYSRQSRQKLANYMDNTLQIDIPNRDTEKEFRDYIPHASHQNQERQTATFSDLKWAISNPRYRQVCPSSQMANLSDVFWKDQHKIKLSWTSCALHDHGKGILAHEIGHAISLLFNPSATEATLKMSAFSANEYQKLRACATKRYKDKAFSPEMPQNDLFAHQKDRLKTEEDTADLFSYMVFQDDPTHYQCALLQTSPDGSKYEGLEVLYKPKTGDPHSTPFLRVLMEAIHKRTKLSSACRKVIRKHKNKINFKPCF